MDRISTKQLATLPIAFKLNGKTVVGRAGRDRSSRRRSSTASTIPHLCYMDGMRPDGNCRACMVEIKGERVLAPSCCRYPDAGHGGHHRQPARAPARRWCSSCCSSDMPETRYTLQLRARSSGRRSSASASRASPRAQQPAEDLSHPAMAVNLDACIQCTRCVRACREEQVNDVIGYAFRGEHSKIVFDLDDPMGDSTCVACGECVQACPTGALMPAREAGTIVADKKVDSVCPYCGVGCQLTYHVKDNTILYVRAATARRTTSRLCVKGRYGFDYVQHRSA